MKEEHTGENFLRGSGLYTTDKTGVFYTKKWDIDDDITERVESIKYYKNQIEEDEEKIKTINNILKEGQKNKTYTA